VDGIALALVLDVSNSMSRADYPTANAGTVSRLAAAKQAFRLFVAGGAAPDGVTFDGRPNDQIALITFAAVPYTTCPLTLNHSVLLKVLDEQKSLDGIHAGTNVGDALAEAAIRLEAAGDRPKVILLLSDGEHNRTGNGVLTPTQTADLAAKLGIPIHTIDCGGDGSVGDAEERKQREDGRATLEAVAALTGGRSFVADSGDEMRGVMKGLDGLTRVPAPAPRYRRYHEYGWLCGLLALGGLTALGLLERTRWRALP
jgi:Ca-activated chloride channel family protein